MELGSSVLLSCGHSADVVQNGIKRTRMNRTAVLKRLEHFVRACVLAESPGCALQFNFIGMRCDVLHYTYYQVCNFRERVLSLSLFRVATNEKLSTCETRSARFARNMLSASFTEKEGE